MQAGSALGGGPSASYVLHRFAGRFSAPDSDDVHHHGKCCVDYHHDAGDNTVTTAPPHATTTSSTTTTTSSPTTTAPSTTTTVIVVPPMQCSLGSDLDPGDCYYWGYVVDVDASVPTLDFDLVLIETGESDFEIINSNPLIRELPLADDVTVAACPTDPGSTVPNECGNPEFDEFPVRELAIWVGNGYDFWGLVLDNDEVALIQQWCWP